MDSEQAGLQVEPEQEALLRAEGIMGQGYGLIPKLVMVDPELSITAKAIYAYLCSLAGGGETAFPSISNIVHTLQINKDTYYKHLRGLKERGWVFSSQSRSKSALFAHNVYTLCSKSYKIVSIQPDEPAGSDVLHTRLVSEGIRSAGYGMIPRRVMLDSQLTASAKAVYAYFCSFAGAGQVAFPRRSTMLYHLNMSPNTCRKTLHQLIELGYIAIRQRREKGTFTVSDYYLLDSPDEAAKERAGPPVTNFSDTVKSDAVKSDAAKPDTVQSDTVKPDTTNNSPTITSPKKTSFSSNKSISHTDWRITIEAEPENLPNLIRQMDRQTIERYIAQDIGLDIIELLNPQETRKRIAYLIGLVAEALHYPSLRVSGVEHPPDQFIPKLLALAIEEYQWVLDKVDRAKGVQNLKAYYLSCLYNAHEDMEAAIEQEIRADQT